jgi:hypothetical protein
MVITRFTGGLGPVLGLACAATLVIGMIGSPAAIAATPSVSLGSAANSAVLAGSTIANTGLPPGKVNGTVHAADSVATTTSLISSANPTSANRPVTFTAVVTAAAGTAVPTGLVVFMDRSALIGVVELDNAGKAALVASRQTVDIHLIDAVYIGAEGFLSSTAPRVYQLVQ